MEELKGGGALEAEIREDARRKAERALKQADKEAEAARADWEARSRAELAALEDAQRKRAATYRDEVLARLPLERKRARLAWLDSLLASELSSARDALQRADALRLLLSRLAPAANAFAGGRASVVVRGFDRGAADADIMALLPGAEVRYEEAAAGAAGLEARSADGATVFTVTLDSALREFAERERGELARALVGDLAERDPALDGKDGAR